MTKTVAGVLLAIISIGLVGGIVYTNNKDMDGMDMSSSSQPNSSGESNSPFTNPDKDMSSDQIQEGEVKMDISNFAFTQKTLKVKKGTKVTWTNKDSAKHDITPDKESPDFVASELLSKDKSYSFTFSVAGKYSYYCSPHPYMKASVEVVDG